MKALEIDCMFMFLTGQSYCIGSCKRLYPFYNLLVLHLLAPIVESLEMLSLETLKFGLFFYGVKISCPFPVRLS